MGKRVFLNRSGNITAAQPGADPVNTLNRPLVSAEAATVRAEAAEAKVRSMGEEATMLLIKLNELELHNQALQQDVKTALDKCEAAEAALAIAKKATAAAKKKTKAAEAELAATMAAKPTEAPEVVGMPVEEPATKKPARRKKNPPTPKTAVKRHHGKK